MRIDVPDGQEPLVYLQTQIASPQLRAVLQSIWQVWWYAKDSTVTPKEREAVRYYLAYLVDCNACANFRAARDVPGYSDEEMSDEWYDNVPNFKTWPGFTDRERVAIEFCSRLLDDHLNVEQDNDLWGRLQASFNQLEIEDLVVSTALIGASNTIREVFLGPTPACPVDAERTASREVDLGSGRSHPDRRDEPSRI